MAVDGRVPEYQSENKVWDAVYFCCNVARDRRTENLCQVDAVTPRGTMNRQKCPQAEVCATAKVVRVKGRPGWPAVRACKQPLLRSETCKKIVFFVPNLEQIESEKKGEREKETRQQRRAHVRRQQIRRGRVYQKPCVFGWRNMCLW